MSRRDEWLNKILTDERLKDTDVIRLTKVARWLDAGRKIEQGRRRLPPGEPKKAK